MHDESVLLRSARRMSAEGGVTVTLGDVSKVGFMIDTFFRVPLPLSATCLHPPLTQNLSSKIRHIRLYEHITKG